MIKISDPSAGAVTLLLVDDDQVDVRGVTRALRKKGIDNPIVVARNGLEALDMLRGENNQAKIQKPFLILLDINMPQMNGLELLETLRSDRNLSDSIVFMLTTSDDERDKLAAYTHHVAGYILKERAGADFINLVTMLERFIITVRFIENHKTS